MRLVKLLILLLSLTVVTGKPAGAATDRRVALVIGNGGYRHVAELRTPRSDAQAIAAALGRLGFAVELELDLDRRAMQRALSGFGRAAETAEVALLFYAGHGLQAAGENYLLPVDAALEHARDLRDAALPLEVVLYEVAKAQRLSVVILDAGRASPFTGQLRDALGPSRAPPAGDGLARITELPADTMVVLAAGPHQVALDGAGEHSPFTAALLRHLGEPAADLEQMLREVRDTVRMMTGNRQQPAYYAAMGTEASSYGLSPPRALPEAELAYALPREEAREIDPVKTRAIRADDGTLVQVFYGTDRVNAGTADAPRFSGERARQLSLGAVVVRIPPGHQIGHVERPWSFGLLGRTLIELPEDPAEHFTVLRIELKDEAGFVDELSRVVDASAAYEDQAFVFVHGYNVGFEAAAFRTAQIAHDLHFDGAPILYSWPSRGDLTDYEYDQNSASQARPFLKEFLGLVRRRSGAEVVHLIAHSMGTGPLMEVLAELNVEEADADGPLFNEIVLAAPDIDVDVFYYLAKRIQGIADGITLYASSEDRAMQASRQYARGVPRAGDVPEAGPVIEPGIDTIDASAIGTGFFGLNHSVYAENRILLNDIGLLLRAGLRPPDARNLTLVRMPGSEGYYWKYPD